MTHDKLIASLREWIEKQKKYYLDCYDTWAPSAVQREQGIAEDAKLSVLDDLKYYLDEMEKINGN